jgi:1-acyl-sn-glycerol-3-phosphate acyltransferase
MVADSMWLPRSTCDADCLPAPDSVPRVGAVRAAGRLVAVVAVIVAAAVTSPVIPLLTRDARARLMRAFARGVLGALGVRHTMRGRLPRRGALIVANHVSWLDVLVLLAYAPVRPLAKREVRSWPVIGSIGAAAGAVFIDRDRPRTLPRAVADVAAALRAGHAVAAFPEGTTWCGRSGGRFRPALFQAAIDAGAPVAPVTLRFALSEARTDDADTDDAGTTVAAYIGEDTLLASVRRVIMARGLRVALYAHPALYPMPGASRRVLARAAQLAVAAPRSSTAGTPPVAPPPPQVAPPTAQAMRDSLPLAA